MANPLQLCFSSLSERDVELKSANARQRSGEGTLEMNDPNNTSIPWPMKIKVNF